VSAPVDTRPVIERAESAVREAEFELTTGIELRRCACGTATIVPTPFGFACAGCGAAGVTSTGRGSLWAGATTSSADEIHPRPHQGELREHGMGGELA
jgi:hypothetical protein